MVKRASRDRHNELIGTTRDGSMMTIGQRLHFVVLRENSGERSRCCSRSVCTADEWRERMYRTERMAIPMNERFHEYFSGESRSFDVPMDERRVSKDRQSVHHARWLVILLIFDTMHSLC